jgi:predicted lipoprotein
MPSILINNKSESIDVNNYRNLTELLPAIKESYIHDGESLTSISVNGVNVIKNNQSEFFNKPMDEINSIEISITNKNNILLDSIDSFQSYIDQLFNKITLASKFLKNEQYNLGDTILMDITETIHTFISLISEVHKNLIVDSDLKLKSGTTIKQLEIHLLSVIKAILFAKKKNDNVMLIDLLEHELKDNLTQWKILAIPQIKSLNTL